MGMGVFRPNRQYRQENAMGNAGVLANLMKQKSEANNAITGAIDVFGQDRARGKVSDAMANEQFKDLNPEATQALIQTLTGGRSMGKRGTEMTKQLFGDKSEIRKNTWANELANKNNAATIAASIARAGNNGTKTGQSNEVQGLLDLEHDITLLQNEYNKVDEDLEPGRKDEIKSELRRKRIRSEQAIKNNKYSAGAGKNIIESLFSGSTAASPTGQQGYGKDGKDFSFGALERFGLKSGNVERVQTKKGQPKKWNVRRPNGQWVQVGESTMKQYTRNLPRN